MKYKNIYSASHAKALAIGNLNHKKRPFPT
jgi:hypothetical protein